MDDEPQLAQTLTRKKRLAGRRRQRRVMPHDGESLHGLGYHADQRRARQPRPTVLGTNPPNNS